MAQFTLTEFVGLVTAPGLLVRNQASLVQADNVLIESPGLIESRRGFVRQGTNQPGVVPSMAYTDTDYIYAYNSNPSVYPGKMVSRYINTAGVMSFPTGAPNVNTGADYGFGVGRLKAFSSSGVMYCNSPVRIPATNIYRPQKPIVRVESNASTQARYAGAPLGMAPDTYGMDAAVYSVLYNGTFNFLLPDCSVAYRVTWHRRIGPNRVELGGAPTGRLVVRNISGTSGWAAATPRAVRLRIPIPKELFCTQDFVDTTAWYCKLWRSKSTQAAGEETTDDMNLVAQIAITAADLAVDWVGYLDNTPDTYLDTAPSLHTNVNNIPPGEDNGVAGEQKQGISNSNNPPPFAAHCVWWGGRAWYANYVEIPTNLVTLLAVGGSGLVDNNTFSIGGITLRAKAVPALVTDFQLVTTLATLELNIEATARNIVEVYNRNATASQSRAYYTSVSLFQPGQITIVGTTDSNTAFAAVSLGTPPPFQWDSGAGFVWQKNRIAYSKPGMADHCAPMNFLEVGPSDAEILAVKPLRDKLFVFTSKGVYVVTGTGWWDFSVSEFDLTFKLLGASLVVECEDRLIAWFREGIAEITDGGIEIISGPIEDYIQNYSDDAGYQYVSEIGFAAAYRLRHQALFFYPGNKSVNTVNCERWLAWDVRTRAWTTGSFDLSKTYTQGGFTWYEGKSFATVPVNPTSPDLLVAWGVNGSGVGYQFIEGVTPYEQNSDGTVSVPQAKVRFQFIAPDTSAGAHWQQTLVHLPSDNGIMGNPPILDDYFAPTVFGVTHRAAGLSGALEGAEQLVTTFSNALVRVEPPANARRGQKMQLYLRWTPSSAAPFGIVGVTQTFRPGTANPKGQP